MTAPALTFLGGAGTVTGSRFLVEHGETRLLVEVGMFQGLRELRRRNWEPFAVPPSSVEAIVLTHAHLDHCGYLPRLVRDGFRGPVLCTEDTARLAEIVLRDSAHIQEEDAALANEGGYSRHAPALPLYDSSDVERSLGLFRPVPYGAETPFGARATVTLQPAGHILGSAVASLELAGTRTVFSGDLGRPGHPLLEAPGPPPPAGTIVLESTYGDRLHPAARPDVLADAVNRTVRRGGVVLIPAFAVDRTELVLEELRRLAGTGRIPDVPVFVDSPMALRTLAVYRRALARGGPGVRRGLPGIDKLFNPGDLRLAASAQESEKLNSPRTPCIIVSSSGMATGGRIVHHLLHQLPDPRNCVVLTGYQAIGTRGRDLLEGARQVKIHGRYVRVRAEVVDIPDYSVHADADDLLRWLSTAPGPPEVVYVVHGEPSAASALATRIRDELGWPAVVPRLGERVLLGSAIPRTGGPSRTYIRRTWAAPC